MDSPNIEQTEINHLDVALSNNINASDLDEETNKKLRGDAIGDTLYSQSFVLKTLLQFSNLEWSDEVEEDLCFLWDMTVETDVCKYLFQISYPSLACSALEKHSEERFIEIVIGILANILCADCEKKISEDEINTVLKELNTDDPLVLIQIVRFLTAIAHVYNDLPFVTKDILDKIFFILNNSTNNELLLKSLEALSKITNDFKLDKNLINIEILKSCLTAYKSVINGLDEFGFDTKEKQLCCKYMLEVVTNYCAYINILDNGDLVVEFRNCSDMFVNEIIKILYHFSHEEHLLPITDEFIYYMSVIKFILESLEANYFSDIFFPLTKILYIISNIKDDVIELFNTVVELEFFLIAHCTPEVLYLDLKSLSKNKAKKILSILSENQHKFDCNINLQHLSNKIK